MCRDRLILNQAHDPSACQVDATASSDPTLGPPGVVDARYRSRSFDITEQTEIRFLELLDALVADALGHLLSTVISLALLLSATLRITVDV